MLTNEPGWEPETVEQAADRARAERGELGSAESGGAARRIGAELEREGFKHRLRYRAPGAAVRHRGALLRLAGAAVRGPGPAHLRGPRHHLHRNRGPARPAKRKPQVAPTPRIPGVATRRPPQNRGLGATCGNRCFPGRSRPRAPLTAGVGDRGPGVLPEDDHQKTNRQKTKSTPTGQKTPGPPAVRAAWRRGPGQTPHQLHDQAVARDRAHRRRWPANTSCTPPTSAPRCRAGSTAACTAAEARNRIRARDRRPAGRGARNDAGAPASGRSPRTMGLSVHQVTGDVASLGHTCDGKPLWDYPEAERASVPADLPGRWTGGSGPASRSRRLPRQSTARPPRSRPTWTPQAGRWAAEPLSSCRTASSADLRVPSGAACGGPRGRAGHLRPARLRRAVHRSRPRPEVLHARLPAGRADPPGRAAAAGPAPKPLWCPGRAGPYRWVQVPRAWLSPVRSATLAGRAGPGQASGWARGLAAAGVSRSLRRRGAPPSQVGSRPPSAAGTFPMGPAAHGRLRRVRGPRGQVHGLDGRPPAGRGRGRRRAATSGRRRGR